MKLGLWLGTSEVPYAEDRDDCRISNVVEDKLPVHFTSATTRFWRKA